MPSHNMEGILYKTRLLKLPCGWPNSCYDYCVVGCPCQLLPNASTTFFTHIVFFSVLLSVILPCPECALFYRSWDWNLVARQKFMIRTLGKKVSDHNFLWQSSMKRTLGLHPLLGPFEFSKVPIINGPLKLLLFTCKIEISIVLHLTW